jgi:hypothetical protein
VRHVHHERVGEDEKVCADGRQLHRVRHFVPAKAEKTSVVPEDVGRDDHVRLKVGLPFYLQEKMKSGSKLI